MNLVPGKSKELMKLTRAFENGDLMLHYQPQVDVSCLWPQIIGYEALARWPLPDGTFIPPDRFIPVAEDSGLILTIDLWVIEGVCNKLALMNAADRARRIGMSANVSPQHFRQPHFAQAVDDILTRAGVDPCCLTLEITERAMLDQDDITLANIRQLHEIGVTLSLDDFGTGYSSLLHLRALPIQEVKLDRCFISGLPHRQRDIAIIRATIDLAADLGLRVVAEGVEQAQHANWLRLNGCRTIQGFLYGRPTARIHTAAPTVPKTPTHQ